jgi:hypothetical protein
MIYTEETSPTDFLTSGGKEQRSWFNKHYFLMSLYGFAPLSDVVMPPNVGERHLSIISLTLKKRNNVRIVSLKVSDMSVVRVLIQWLGHIHRPERNSDSTVVKMYEDRFFIFAC